MKSIHSYVLYHEINLENGTTIIPEAIGRFSSEDELLKASEYYVKSNRLTPPSSLIFSNEYRIIFDDLSEMLTLQNANRTDTQLATIARNLPRLQFNDLFFVIRGYVPVANGISKNMYIYTNGFSTYYTAETAVNYLKMKGHIYDPEIITLKIFTTAEEFISCEETSSDERIFRNALSNGLISKERYLRKQDKQIAQHFDGSLNI